MKKLLQTLKCWLGDHDWTCKAEQGIKATDAQLKGGVAGFNDYATMYCGHCKKVYIP